MATMVERLPAGFQTDPALSQAVDSGLGSVSSGVQAAQQSSPAEIQDLVESFGACLPPIETSQEPFSSISDAGAIQSPDGYLNNASHVSGDDSLAGFSDLVSMNQVAERLSDPK